MMFAKRGLALLLALVLALSLGACSSVRKAAEEEEAAAARAESAAVEESSAAQEPAATEKPTPEPTEEPTPEPTEEPAPEPTEEPTPEPAEEPAEEDDFLQSAAYDQIVTTIEGSFEDYDPEFDYDPEDKVFTISICSPSGTMVALTAGNQSVTEAWQTFTESMLTLSNTIHSLCNASGYSDVKVLMNVRNDSNEDKVIYSCVNGTKVYDVMDDLD